MRIGVVSDTHGHVDYTRQAIRMLESCEIELVIHCGDIGSEDVVRLFQPWPTHFVFGNVDYDRQRLRAAIQTAGQTCHDRFGNLEVAGKRIAFLHGDDSVLLAQTIAAGQHDLVCYGHSHIAEHHIDGNTVVLNPGALYRAQPHSIALVDLPAIEIAHVTL